jgi:glycine hydroxymethyltransferase
MVFNVEASFGLTGRQAETALREAHLTVNRNAVPFDANGPWYTSGVRIGTPASTTLGMKEKEMMVIAEIIVDVLKGTKASLVEKTGEKSKAKSVTDPKVLQEARTKIVDLLKHFPLYPELVIE